MKTIYIDIDRTFVDDNLRARITVGCPSEDHIEEILKCEIEYADKEKLLKNLCDFLSKHIK